MNLTALIKNRWLHLMVVLSVGAALRFMLLTTVPSGIFHDEAWSAAKAWSMLSGETPPQIYFAENNGMDALHVYLIALLFVFTGPLAIGSRLASALVGCLTIPATYGLATELFHDDQRRDTIAWTAAFVIATLFPAVAVSRSGWHAMSMALLSTAGLAALSRGLRLNRRRWFIVAGAMAGLAQYTYPSARLLPVLFVVIGFIAWLTNRPQRRSIAWNYLGLITSAAIVFAPLALYFIQHPEWLFARAQQTSESIDLIQNLIKTTAAFSFQGDLDNLHNLPGRPLFDPILSVFFVVGLGACGVKRRSPHTSLIAALIVLSLPVILTNPAPLTRRWAGAMPIASIIAALGIVTVTRLIRARSRTALGHTFSSIILAAVLIISAGLSAADYFGPYASNPQLFWTYDSGITQVANYIRTRSDATIFLTPYDRFYEVVEMTLAGAKRPPIQSYNGQACVLFPEVTDRVTDWIVINEKDQNTLPAIRHLFPNNQVVWRLNSPVGPYARALQVPPHQTARLELPQRARVEFDRKLQLIGFDRPVSLRAGESARVQLALKDVAPLDQLYTIFVHLRNADNTLVAQADHPPCAASLNETDWRPGNIVLDDFTLAIPASVPAGRYDLIVGVYQAASGVRLPVSASDLPHGVDEARLGALEVK